MPSMEIMILLVRLVLLLLFFFISFVRHSLSIDFLSTAHMSSC